MFLLHVSTIECHILARRSLPQDSDHVTLFLCICAAFSALDGTTEPTK